MTTSALYEQADRLRTGQSHTMQTARLTLTPVEPSMLAELHNLFTNPAVRRYLLDDDIVDVNWVADGIATSQQQFLQTNYGLWTVQRAGYRPILGVCGYFMFNQMQLLYALRPEYWRQGFATEAARAVVDYGFYRAGLTEIVAAADLLNVASFDVMTRLDMTYWKAEKGLIYFRLRNERLATKRTYPDRNNRIVTVG